MFHQQLAVFHTLTYNQQLTVFSRPLLSMLNSLLIQVLTSVIYTHSRKKCSTNFFSISAVPGRFVCSTFDIDNWLDAEELRQQQRTILKV